MQHVATWKEGDERWAYHEDAFQHIGTHKVSLDPYRLESRRIFACIKDVLPPTPMQRVEKASVDEVFLDLSAQVHAVLLERYSELRGPPPYDDPTEQLPRPSTTALDWDTDAVVDLDEEETEEDDPDWDDVVMLIGSEIVRKVRAAILDRLKYTCSAGIARNKMIAKLGSGHRKPNQQTIVRTRAIQQFLSTFKFTKIRNLGGKLGDEVVATFGTDQVTELLKVSLEQMKAKIGDDTGSWIYHVIRGEESSEVNPRTQIKSMLSAKSFRPTINTIDQAHRWLRIFAADIFSRLVEEGVLENKRRPKTMNLHHRQGAQTRSRQAPIPTGRPIDEALLFNIAKHILALIIVDGRAWPCSNLSLSVGGFEEGPTGNKGIGGFLVRGEEAKLLAGTRGHSRPASPSGDQRPTKSLRSGHGSVPTLFARQSTSDQERDASSDPGNWTEQDDVLPVEANDVKTLAENSPSAEAHSSSLDQDTGKGDHFPRANPSSAHQLSIQPFLCGRCKAKITDTNKEEHDDWHLAQDLQAEERATPDYSSLSNTSKRKGPGRPANLAAPSKVEKGQSRLVFGK